MEFFASMWSTIVVFFWAFVFIAALFAYITVAIDLVRDSDLSGWWKALWLVFLVFVPLLTCLVYLIARGRGMAERTAGENRKAQEATERYIRQVASVSPSEEIAKAKGLLEAGAITSEEFTTLKQRVLAA